MYLGVTRNHHARFSTIYGGVSDLFYWYSIKIFAH